MEPLFEIGPVYDPHVKGIISAMLLKLRNNSPKPGSKIWIKNANFIKEIYEGKYHLRRFNMERGDYNYDGVFDKIKAVKGNWQEVKNLIMKSVDNSFLSARREYMPFNKRFVESIGFGSYFEFRDMVRGGQGVSSHFLNFINPPKKYLEYASEEAIGKIKKTCSRSIEAVGERICKKRFTSSPDKALFWRCLSDFTRWLSNLKSAFPSEYDEFILNCDGGNPLEDFDKYLSTSLSAKTGGNYVVTPFHYLLSHKDSDKLEGNFLNWLRFGMERGKFRSLSRLPKSVDKYYSDESFKSKAAASVKKDSELETVDFEELDFTF